MKITFLGAAQEVTGSCYYLEANGKKILIDFGLEQGRDSATHKDVPIPPNEIDFVFLTHAHIDHSGRLPLLSKYGFQGKIFTTDPTMDLCGIMLRDSAHIQEFEAEWRSRKGKRLGKDPVEPLYKMEDAENVLTTFVPCEYMKKIQVAEGIEIRFVDVGHLLGSASIEIWVTENGVTKKIAFSGDIGNFNMPLIKDPSYITESDYVVMESTYGDRLHNPPIDYASSLAEIIKETFDRGGNLVIPSFAVGRTQEILYFIREIKAKNLVQGHGDFKVFVDSPLANEATHIFHENALESFDKEAMELLSKGINPISFSNLTLSVSADESKAINFIQEPVVIISASGMCEAGRIKHHLKHNLWRRESTVLFVGYQAIGTTGRAILDGVDTIKLFGEEISVRAKIVQLLGISGHADQNGLLQWIDAYENQPKHIFVTHGDPLVSEFFANLLGEKGFSNVSVPLYGEVHDLMTDQLIQEGVPSERQAPGQPREIRTEEGTVYGKLISAGNLLSRVIQHNKGGANKDLNKFTQEIIDLAEKWNR